MADSSPDYKALYLQSRDALSQSREALLQEREARIQAEETRKNEEVARRNAEEAQRNAEEAQRNAEEARRDAEEARRDAEEAQRNAEEQLRPLTYNEFVEACHNLLSRPFKAAPIWASTKGAIPKPTGKYCPTQLALWSDYPTTHQRLYESVLRYLPEDTRLFRSMNALADIAQRIHRHLCSSEKHLEIYERFAVHDLVAALCQIPEARSEFQLGDGIRFENHIKFIDVDRDNEAEASDTRKPIPDQFCIHRVEGGTETILTTVEYKPPHKLSSENLRAGLHTMNFYEEIVQRDTIPTDKDQKLRYNAEQVAGSALVQEYHVMIQEGLQYSYLTTGLALVMLYVPEDNPGTCYYYLCEPNLDIDKSPVFDASKTAIARILSLCLMSFGTSVRSQDWRNTARGQLNMWTSGFDHTRAGIPDAELKQAPPDSHYGSSESLSDEFLPSSPLDSKSTASDPQVRTRSQCGPDDILRDPDNLDSSDSDSNQVAPRRKRNLSQLTASPPSQRTSRQAIPNQGKSDHRRRQHTALYCTQRCLLGLGKGSLLDEHCPNVELHRQGQATNHHLISTETLVRLLKEQLDRDLDNDCTPFGFCCGYSAPFKITCASHGYTVVGKGTTLRYRDEISREVDVYRILRKAQGSAVPVFLGAIDLAKVYFLHGAGEIRYMLLMGWGGQATNEMDHTQQLIREIHRSRREIERLGIVHGDFRYMNILWNEELGRALIIDFHRSTLAPRRKAMAKREEKEKTEAGRKRLGNAQETECKRLRLAERLL